jgi:hypothetical protein
VARVKVSGEWNLELLDCFTVFAGMSLVMAELQDFAQLRQIHQFRRELELKIIRDSDLPIFPLRFPLSFQ